MNDTNATSIAIGKAPATYDPIYIDQMLRKIETSITALASRGPIRVASINISDLPTSATGLRSGDLWNNSNVVNIVP